MLLEHPKICLKWTSHSLPSLGHIYNIIWYFVLYTLAVCSQSMINLECGSVDVCLAPIIIHLTDHGCNWMNYVFCLDGLYLQTAKNLWHNAICGNFLDYSAQKREPNSIHLLLSILLFLCSSQLGLSFLLYPIGLPIVKLFACFITAMLIELSPCIAVHNGKKLKRWAFHMGHVIEHWLWMTTFIGLPVMRSVWYCDCVMPFVPRHIGCVVNPRSVEWRGINFSCFPRGICLQILNPKSWWVSWDGWAHC